MVTMLVHRLFISQTTTPEDIKALATMDSLLMDNKHKVAMLEVKVNKEVVKDNREADTVSNREADTVSNREADTVSNREAATVNRAVATGNRAAVTTVLNTVLKKLSTKWSCLKIRSRSLVITTKCVPLPD